MSLLIGATSVGEPLIEGNVVIVGKVLSLPVGNKVLVGPRVIVGTELLLGDEVVVGTGVPLGNDVLVGTGVPLGNEVLVGNGVFVGYKLLLGEKVGTFSVCRAHEEGSSVPLPIHAIAITKSCPFRFIIFSQLLLPL